MDNISIISIPDSDTSAGVMNETYSPRNPTLPITPKREAVDSPANTTFTPEPEDGKNATTNIQNETFSPVKDIPLPPPPPIMKPLKSALKSPAAANRNSQTPIRKKSNAAIAEQNNNKEFESPTPNPVPDIIIVPPSTDRMTLRRSSRTPAKFVDYAPPAAARRRSARQTPLKTVPENDTKKKKKEEEDVTKVVSPEKKVEDEAPAAPKEPDVFRAPASPPLLLKSIRKRSLSVADVDPPVVLAKRNFRVQFHSPGNMEKTITEIDESLYLNFSKTLASSFSVAANQSLNETGTKNNKPARRKRSLSNAETPVDKLATLKMFREKEAAKASSSGGNGKKMPTPSPRKKMPNFAAIHQSIFQQMESLVDFSERKKERAQFLLNPTVTFTAPPPISGTSVANSRVGGPTIAKPVNRGAIGKTAMALKKSSTSSSNLMKAKHRTIGKNKLVTGAKLTDKKLQAFLQSEDFPALLGETGPEMVLDDPKEVTVTAPVEAEPIEKVIEEEKIAVKDEGTIVEEVKENLIVTVQKESRIRQPRKPMTTTAAAGKGPSQLKREISTVGQVKNEQPIAAVKQNGPLVAKVPPFSVKVEPQNVSKSLNTSSYTMVKGVRMNRRFELMMKHRNTTNKQTGKK